MSVFHIFHIKYVPYVRVNCFIGFRMKTHFRYALVRNSICIKRGPRMIIISDCINIVSIYIIDGILLKRSI